MKILLVEDDQAVRLLIAKVLQTHHAIEVAEDGRSALALAKQFEYDLLILDIGIPDLDGISVCRHLRAQGCQFPILLLTAKDGASDRVLGLDAGADDYMVKPFHVPELLARIRALGRRSKAATTAVITWGNLHFDSLTNEIRHAEQLLSLTPKEHGILELLLLNPQRIFSRSAIIDRLWELEDTPTESAVSSHIKAIRQKLKAAGAQQDLIETMYGFGYRLRSTLPSQRALLEVTPTSQEKTLEAEPGFSPEAADAVMLELWERFKDSFSAQLDLLDQVVSALQDGSLTVDLRQEAQQVVHKLIGSLGVYGFPQGSVLARQIEALLHPDCALGAADTQQLTQWLADLREEVSRKPQSAVSPISPALRLPTILVVDDDTDLTERLKAEAIVQSLRLTTAANPLAAQLSFDHDRPDIILLDLTFANSNEDGLVWLEVLQREHPQIPVLVFTGRDSLSDRLAASRLGARFFLQKPMTVAQIFQALTQALSPQQTPTGKVMVVDDDPLIVYQVSGVLPSWGLQVIPLLEPARFWEVLTHTMPDLLILDIEMPGLSGIELCQVVRHDANWGNLPILFLTAHQEAEMIAAAFAAGGDDYIRKPILEAELVARVLNRLEVGQLRRQRLS